MIPESESGQRPRPVRLPPRATPGVRPSPPLRWLVNPFSLCRKGLRRVGTFAGARVQSFAENPQPWVFITGACVCLMLTFVVIMVKNANEARPHVEVARADAGESAETHHDIQRETPARPQIAISPKPAAVELPPAKETTFGALQRLARPDSLNAEEPKTRLRNAPLGRSRSPQCRAATRRGSPGRSAPSSRACRRQFARRSESGPP